MLLFSMVVTVLIVEVLLSIVVKEKTVEIFEDDVIHDRYDSVVGWTNYKGITYRLEGREYSNSITTNDEGFVDAFWNITPEKGVKRIVALGDSFTEAVQVPREQRFTDILENISTHKGGSKLEILNFGVGGYSPCEEIRVWQKKANLYTPEIVIMFFYVGNDFQGNFDRYGSGVYCFVQDKKVKTGFNDVQHKNDFVEMTISKFFQETNIGLLLLRTLRYSSLSISVAELVGIEPHTSIVDLFDIEKNDTSYFGNTADILVAFARELQLENKKVYIVLIPHQAQVDLKILDSLANKFNYLPSRLDSNRPTEFLKNKLSSASIPFVDLTGNFRKAFNNGSMIYFQRDGHLTSDGHLLVANEVYQTLQSDDGKH